MKTGVRLVDGSRELVLHPSPNWVPQALTVSSPEIREVAESRTEDDGERDSTLFFGARAVSLEVVALDERSSPEVLLDTVHRFLHPRSRPYLYVTDEGWPQERRIRLRVDQWSEPYAGYVSSRRRDLQLQWKAPDGVWESADLTTVTLAADITTDSTGLTFPVAFPVAFTPTMATGASLVSNAGSTPSHFIARMYGPCTAPVLRNETTGEQIAFTDSLALAAGEYVEVNTRDRSANLLSTGNSRLGYVDFESTSWWRLEPGDNQIRYAPGDADAGSQAVILYRPAWL